MRRHSRLCRYPLTPKVRSGCRHGQAGVHATPSIYLKGLLRRHLGAGHLGTEGAREAGGRTRQASHFLRRRLRPSRTSIELGRAEAGRRSRRSDTVINALFELCGRLCEDYLDGEQPQFDNRRTLDLRPLSLSGPWFRPTGSSIPLNHSCALTS